MLSRQMENTMFTLRTHPMRIMSVRKKKSIGKNKNIVSIVKEGLQQTMVRQPWHVHRDATPQMMVTSLMHPISLKILVMLISFLMATITITFLRASYQPANWLLQKPFYLVEVANQRRLLIAVPITTVLAAMQIDGAHPIITKAVAIRTRTHLTTVVTIVKQVKVMRILIAF